MNSATIFAIITAVGLLSCGLRERSDLLILPIITSLSFLATIFAQLKPKTQVFILTRISQLPLPRWMTPLIWLSLSIVLILLAILLVSMLVGWLGCFISLKQFLKQ